MASLSHPPAPFPLPRAQDHRGPRHGTWDDVLACPRQRRSLCQAPGATRHGVWGRLRAPACPLQRLPDPSPGKGSSRIPLDADSATDTEQTCASWKGAP